MTSGTLTVTKAALSVKANDKQRSYGDSNPALDGVSTGLLSGDNVTVAYTTVATENSPVGTYAISPSLNDPDNKLSNYTVTKIDGTLTIGAVALTVTAANATRPYGDQNPGFTGTVAGLKNNDNISALYTSTATQASPVGTYSIVPTFEDTTGKLTNYTVTSNNGVLTIGAVALTVTATNATRPYGDQNPASPVPSRTQDNDNISALYTSTATQASPVGAYPSLVLWKTQPASSPTTPSARDRQAI